MFWASLPYTLEFGGLLAGLLLTGMVLLRGYRRARVTARRDPLAEVQREVQTAAESPLGHIQRAHVQLHEFEREVTGKLHTRLAALDQLILDADARITRLQQILQEARRDQGHPAPTTGTPDPHPPAAPEAPELSDRRAA